MDVEKVPEYFGKAETITKILTQITKGPQEAIFVLLASAAALTLTERAPGRTATQALEDAKNLLEVLYRHMEKQDVA